MPLPAFSLCFLQWAEKHTAIRGMVSANYLLNWTVFLKWTLKDSWNPLPALQNWKLYQILNHRWRKQAGLFWGTELWLLYAIIVNDPCQLFLESQYFPGGEETLFLMQNILHSSVVLSQYICMIFNSLIILLQEWMQKSCYRCCRPQKHLERRSYFLLPRLKEVDDLFFSWNEILFFLKNESPL